MLTYKQAYDKIIDAYFQDEIKPLSSEFCFCGTLSPDNYWDTHENRQYQDYPYTVEEYGTMEKALIQFFKECFWHSPGRVDSPDNIYASNAHKLLKNYEENLFLGMCAALDVLKEIHRARGEDVDSIEDPFKKRNLQKLTSDKVIEEVKI